MALSFACTQKREATNKMAENGVGCRCSEEKRQGDTIVYTASLVYGDYSIEVKTMTYDSSVIAKEEMALDDNVVGQSITFKRKGFVINEYPVPSELEKVSEIYPDFDHQNLKKKNKLMSLNELTTVRLLFANNKLYYIFSGHENYIEKREYHMVSDADGTIIYESYIETKGSIESFMKETGLYDKWIKGMYLPEYDLFTYKLCCKKTTTLLVF